MMPGQGLIEESKRASIINQKSLDSQLDKKRSEISRKLSKHDLTWEEYQGIFKEIGELVPLTGSLEDIKLWFAFFTKAVEFNQVLKDKNPIGSNHSRALLDEWRTLREAHSDLLGRLSSRLADHKENKVLIDSFIAAVDYKKQLIYSAFTPSSKDAPTDIMNEQYEKDANALRWKQRFQHAKAWCSKFSCSKSSTEVEQDLNYISFEQSESVVSPPAPSPAARR
jgi:hypothetical protein